jgi:hypothetical protein
MPDLYGMTAYNSIDNANVLIRPPTGESLESGSTYSIANSPDATHAEFQIGLGVLSCGLAGQLHVDELVITDGAVSAFAVSWVATCSTDSANDTSGSARWHSSLPYIGPQTDANILDFGYTDIGRLGVSKTLTVSNRGPSS